MLEQGICQPSKSPWASPLHLVQKKNGELRPCGDYRKLNAVTKPDRYPNPRLRDFTYRLQGMKIFSKIDLRKAYNQLRIRKEDIEKTAVITPFGLFEFPRMCFGLRNAGQTFQRHMNNILGDLDFVYPFVDDILLASPDQARHRQHLEEVFKRLQEHGLRINVSKCVFGKPKLEFLGYDVSADGIQPIEERVKSIQNYPQPKTIQELRRFLGIINFYKESIPHAAHTQEKLFKYLRTSKKNDKTQIHLTTEEKQAFEACRNSIKNAVMLSHPSTHATLSLMCDASNSCVGAALQQYVNGKWQPLGFFSKKLTAAQTKYSTYDRELLAIYLAIRHFRRMFEGKEITVFTDHKPLTFALLRENSKTETPIRTRYLHFISQFTSKILHVEGKDNVVADALSRIEAITSPSPIDYNELARQQHDDSEVENVIRNKSLRFERIKPIDSNYRILCETSTDSARPYIPTQLRRTVFTAIHEMSHPGIRATRHLITKRFFWPNMNVDINNWTRSCIACQQTKTHRHTVSPLEAFPLVHRLSHIHIDIIGPLPISEGKRYCVTMIDRTTRWPEAYPVADITAETVARAVYEGWIARYGCPEKLTSDQGRQFESELFKNLMKRLGIERTRTTAYHPQANGIIERHRRTLKTALTARLQNSSWTNELPTVMLGLRATIKNDTDVSAAEALYGQSLRLPGEMIGEKITKYTQSHYEDVITSAMKKLNAAHINTDRRTTYIPRLLRTCSHVFVRNDAVRRPLTPTYNGPHRVLQRNDKTYTIQADGKTKTISIDRLKPAFLLDSQPEAEVIRHAAYTTRTGRCSKPPVRFAGEEPCTRHLQAA
ncbi:hypothetical protein PYW07_003861 [Mythimna separata]|uniref:RNA-directed DNA polymerase n=1 Tax=Mythimna separata TaxID=271217 RepID=A0AAD7YNK6_MYTSE|nr:hypothetical protein PYW07_003861 [Mythimna separata]